MVRTKKCQKHIRLADKSKSGWSTVHEYKMTKIVDDSDNGKKMFKAKAHLKLSVSRCTPVTSWLQSFKIQVQIN